MIRRSEKRKLGCVRTEAIAVWEGTEDQISYKLSQISKTSRRDEYYIYIHKFLSIDLWLAVGAGSVSPGS